jgi:DNA invertase Pin-like site-specific DNA recombinase
MSNANNRRAVLYLRVSTDHQDTDAQRSECAGYALRENLPIAHTLDDTASGSLSWRRRGLADLDTKFPGITDVIVYEFSRIGRDLVDTLEFIRHCNDHNITVHVTKTSTVVRADIGGKVLSTVMLLAAEIERDLLRARTKAALQERKRKLKEDGQFISKAGNVVRQLGRPKGSTSESKLEPHREDIKRMRAANVSDAAIARVLQVDRRTVARFITDHKEPA